jgi:hypothetical protein
VWLYHCADYFGVTGYFGLENVVIEIDNIEDAKGKLVCRVVMDKATALRLVENILQQINEQFAEATVFHADNEADLFKVVVS